MTFKLFDFAQRGVALVFSLLLLLVLTIIGVAAMNSTIMQERMSGNIQTQTQSFEVSSEGVGRALEYFHNNFNAVGNAGHADSNGIICGRVHGFDEDADDDDLRQAWAWPGGDNFSTIYDDGLRLEQQMYCCRSWAQVPIGGNQVWVENPSTLFVLSRGSFMTGEGQGAMSLAEREIEVKLEEADPGEPTCAFCVPGEVGSVTAGNSNALRMHGACGPAITTQEPEGAAAFGQAIKEGRRDNYDGGITHGDMGSPWNNPDTLAEFVWWIKLGLHEGDTDNTVDGGYFAGGQSFAGNTRFGCQPNEGQCGGGEWGNPVITYFDGDVTMGGNVSGHGIMIVNGELTWGGTPDFEGLLISLGGRFAVNGGGGGGNPRGSLVTTHLKVDESSQLNTDTGGDMSLALGGREALPYPVAVDGDSYVQIYFPDDFGGGTQVRRAQPGGGMAGSEISERHVPVRPVLRDPGSGARYIYYFDAAADDPHRFFNYTNGAEVTDKLVDTTPDDGVFLFVDSDGAEVASLVPQSDLPRDKFGRLIPNFVPLPDWPDNWPHEDIGYNPNQWGWGDCTDDDDEPVPCAAFAFGASDFHWDGGGNQAFTYDCRWLQRTRQRLLCQDQVVDGEGQFPPDDYEYDDPDSSMLCNHFEWAAEYNDDVLDLAGDMNNHHSWHLWAPSCECLGITRDADMIISGWRENIGWRDDDFAACAGLPAPPSDG